MSFLLKSQWEWQPSLPHSRTPENCHFRSKNRLVAMINSKLASVYALNFSNLYLIRSRRMKRLITSPFLNTNAFTNVLCIYKSQQIPMHSTLLSCGDFICNLFNGRNDEKRLQFISTNSLAISNKETFFVYSFF